MFFSFLCAPPELKRLGWATAEIEGVGGGGVDGDGDGDYERKTNRACDLFKNRI